MKNLDRRHWLLIFSIITGVVVAFKIGYYQAIVAVNPGVLKCVLTQQNGEIIDLDTPRNPKAKREYTIDKLFFPQGDVLSHGLLGLLGYKENFFLDISGKFWTNTEGDYELRVASDDGFRLFIDDKQVGEVNSDRKFSISKFDYYLSKGDHTFRVEYFQRYGPLGLEATYKLKGSNQVYVFGADSSWLHFK